MIVVYNENSILYMLRKLSQEKINTNKSKFNRRLIHMKLYKHMRAFFIK